MFLGKCGTSLLFLEDDVSAAVDNIKELESTEDVEKINVYLDTVVSIVMGSGGGNNSW